MIDKTSSGSILLFHNDLDNTTQALPQILEKLSSEGYEFIKVSDLIYHENYSINADGKQIPDVLSSLGIDGENIDDVMAEYSDEIVAAGISQEQITMATEAIKNGVDIPDDVLAVIADIGDKIIAASAEPAASNDVPDGVDTVSENGGLVQNESIEDKAKPQK